MKDNHNTYNQVKALVDEVDSTHRYSMSRIYGLYNRVFDKAEIPQSCASCLMRKVGELRTWLKAQEAQALQASLANNDLEPAPAFDVSSDADLEPAPDMHTQAFDEPTKKARKRKQ